MYGAALTGGYARNTFRTAHARLSPVPGPSRPAPRRCPAPHPFQACAPPAALREAARTVPRRACSWLVARGAAARAAVLLVPAAQLQPERSKSGSGSEPALLAQPNRRCPHIYLYLSIGGTKIHRAHLVHVRREPSRGSASKIEVHMHGCEDGAESLLTEIHPTCTEHFLFVRLQDLTRAN